jgi:hypothetical protein
LIQCGKWHFNIIFWYYLLCSFYDALCPQTIRLEYITIVTLTRRVWRCQSGTNTPTDNTKGKRKRDQQQSTKHYTENERSSNTNPNKTRNEPRFSGTLAINPVLPWSNFLFKIFKDLCHQHGKTVFSCYIFTYHHLAICICVSIKAEHRQFIHVRRDILQK